MERVMLPTGNESTTVERDKTWPFRRRERKRPVTEEQLHITSLDRAPLRTSYNRIARAVVSKLVELEPVGAFGERADIGLCVDAGGVGRAVVDMIRDELSNRLQIPRVHLWPVTATGGNHVSRNGAFIGVPKRDLITAAVVAFQNGRLKIGDVPNAALLKTELAEYRIKMTARGHDTYEGAGRNDDLVFATCLAAWAWSFTEGPNERTAA
jgi:hypothetical protein